MDGFIVVNIITSVGFLVEQIKFHREKQNDFRGQCSD